VGVGKSSRRGEGCVLVLVFEAEKAGKRRNNAREWRRWAEDRIGRASLAAPFDSPQPHISLIKSQETKI
jgi:hypothetical protein